MSVPRQAAGFTSLNAVTATGAGTAFEVVGCAKFSIQVVLGGTVNATTVSCTLQGSNDGVNYFVLATWSLSGGQASGDVVTAIDKPVRYIRANLGSFSGGTAPTLTAKLSAV
ncbi:MAG: hypothetical protein ACHP7J_00030 [Terriglobales bacterium]